MRLYSVCMFLPLHPCVARDDLQISQVRSMAKNSYIGAMATLESPVAFPGETFGITCGPEAILYELGSSL